jgi:hypothetical protein
MENIRELNAIAYFLFPYNFLLNNYILALISSHSLLPHEVPTKPIKKPLNPSPLKTFHPAKIAPHPANLAPARRPPVAQPNPSSAKPKP